MCPIWVYEGSDRVLEIIDGVTRATRIAKLAPDGTQKAILKRAVADLIGPGRTSGAWLSDGVASMPMPAVAQLNSRLLKYAVKRYTLRKGALLFGKLLPAGIGAVVGAIGNRIAGKKIIRNARKAFGAPPARWPVTLHLLPTAHHISAPGDDAARGGVPH